MRKLLFSHDTIKISLYFIVSALFLALTIPLLYNFTLNFYDARDEIYGHYPIIVSFMKQFPNFDIINYNYYPVLTTPLYHIIMACFALIIGPNLIGLRFVNLSISLICLLMVYRYLSSRGDTIKALYFSAIFMLSPYFIGPAIKISTDNLALLFAIASMYAINYGFPTIRSSIIASILILCAILTRQVYAWLIGAYLIFNLFQFKIARQDSKLLLVNLPLTIPIAGLAFFVFLWKGLNPPNAAVLHTACPNLDIPFYIVSLIGFYGIFLCCWLFAMNKENRPRFFIWPLLAGLGIFLLFLHPVSNEYHPEIPYNSFMYRGGALWSIASHFPMIFSNSIVFLALFPLGLLCVFIMVRYLIFKKDYLMIIAFFLWFMANVVNGKAYQKYYEPFILFFLGYVLINFKIKEKWYNWAGPFVLLAGFLFVAFKRFY